MQRYLRNARGQHRWGKIREAGLVARARLENLEDGRTALRGSDRGLAWIGAERSYVHVGDGWMDSHWNFGITKKINKQISIQPKSSDWRAIYGGEPL